MCADACSEYLEAQIYCRFSRSLTRERGRATKRASPASTTIRRLAVDSRELAHMKTGNFGVKEEGNVPVEGVEKSTYIRQFGHHGRPEVSHHHEECYGGASEIS